MTNVASDDYGPVAKTLHWVTVVLVIIAWTLGMFGEEVSEGSAQESGLLTHIWIGLAILVAVMIKLPLANAGSPDEPAPPTAIM